MKFLSVSRRRDFAVALIVGAIFFVGFALGNQYAVGRAQSAMTEPADVEQAFQPFWQVYNLIQSQYIDKVDTATLVNGATKGLVDSLGDEFSAYMDPKTYALVNSDLTGQFSGIGVVINSNDKTGKISVVSLLAGSPAQVAGIQAGDIFSKVDGTDVTGMNQTDLAGLVRGDPGTKVVITVQRGSQTINFTITRAQITVPNVTTKILSNNIGYIQLNQFTATARADLDSALKTIDVNNRSGLVLDLRDNPGGLLSSAIDIGSAFIKSGTITIEQFGSGQKQSYAATGKYADIKVPIVVLVNEGSASAAELLTGALQDDHLATVIGTQSFGKGTVQTWQDLVNKGGIRLTIAKWLTPLGRWIHKVGITPDIVVPWPNRTYAPNEDDPQLDAAVDFLSTGKVPANLIATPEATAAATAEATESAPSAAATEPVPMTTASPVS